MLLYYHDIINVDFSPTALPLNSIQGVPIINHFNHLFTQIYENFMKYLTEHLLVRRKLKDTEISNIKMDYFAEQLQV